MRARNVIKIATIQILILIVTIAALDTLLYFFLPTGLAEKLPNYRNDTYSVNVIGRGYPQDYFMAHPERGFDIKPTDVPRTDQVHVQDEYSYNVWSNKIGCFDKPIEGMKERFWYMAGDSIAWGHAKFEDLMGSVLEAKKGIDILQCGVTHSGQRHQFSKFLEIGKKLGRWPERVFVFYSPTDVVNDYAYPHTTVVDGELIDTRMLERDHNIVDVGRGWYDQAKAQRKLEAPASDGQPTNFSLSRLLMKYSASAQMLNVGLHKLEDLSPSIGRHIGVLGEEPGLEWSDKYFRYKGKKLYDIHRMAHFQTLDGVLAYANFKYSENNKAVIREWRDHAAANGYRLDFVLPPPGPSWVIPVSDVTNFYKELIAYLTSLGIQYYDLSDELKKRKIETDELYWESDLHLSDEGNRIVGGILAELL